MNVLHTIAGMGVRSGGPSLSTYLLVKGLRAEGVGAEVLTYGNSHADDQMIADDRFIHVLPPPASHRWGYSRAFGEFLAKATDVEVYHTHGLWQYAGHATAQWARHVGKPCLISTRGMLYPEGLKKSWLLKRFALTLYQKRDLDHAACIHATCEQEYGFIRACGVKVPVAVIPNPIEIKGVSVAQPQPGTRKRIGFVGRFAPIKNIESLIEAWSKTGAAASDWELVIVGDGDAGYKRDLLALVARWKIPNILFSGFLSGVEKDAMLATFRFLVLPSKSENFGMVVPEALLRGIPVIASKGTPWSELLGSGGSELSAIGEVSELSAIGEVSELSAIGEVSELSAIGEVSTVSRGSGDSAISRGSAMGVAVRDVTNSLKLNAPNALNRLNTLPPAAFGRCGWWVDSGVEQLGEALREAMRVSEEARTVMGNNGRDLIITKYTMGAVGLNMSRVYAWLLGQEPRPECVRL